VDSETLNCYNIVKQGFIQILRKVDLLKEESLFNSLETPPHMGLGDLSTNIGFNLSKKMKKPPSEIAGIIASKIQIPPESFISRAEARSGYVNVFFNYPKLAKFVLETILTLDQEYGSSNLGESRKIVVEFPSVNPGKPWHIGHARTAVVGDTAQRILRFSGFQVESQNYIDDLGLQVAQMLWGFLNFSKNKMPKRSSLLEKDDQWQGRMYVKAANLFEDNKDVEEQVRKLMKKMETGDLKVKAQLTGLVDLCLKAQYQTAFRLGIYHNLKVHESHIVSSGLYDEAVETILQNAKIIREDSGPNAGCVVAKLEEFPEFEGMKSPEKVLIRSDGTATYTLKDLAYQMWKFGLLKSKMKFTPWLSQPNGDKLMTTADKGVTIPASSNTEKVVNVIGSEQKFTQKVLLYILRLIGYEREFRNSIHLSHEHVWLKGEQPKSLSGRAGTWIGFTADEVLDEAVRRAYQEVEKRNPSMPETDKKRIAESVGTAAFRFSLLNTSLDKTVDFDYDTALSFKGETGSYLQYAHTRICGILRKAGEWKKSYGIGSLTKSEKNLILLLAKFTEIVEQSAKDLKLNSICKYTCNLATALDKFYESCPVLSAENKDLRNFRLTLIAATKITLKNALTLIGIQPLEKM
jgi:arginyl-tRNA synthetase